MGVEEKKSVISNFEKEVQIDVVMIAGTPSTACTKGLKRKRANSGSFASDGPETFWVAFDSVVH